METALIQKMLRDLEQNGGSKAEAHLTVAKNEVYTFFRPNGLSDDIYIIGRGATPEETISDARSKWDEMHERVKGDRIKKIALAIIRITHEQGQCTDAALRVEFPSQDLDRYRTDALTLANVMADNGPFEIIELAGANAA